MTTLKDKRQSKLTASVIIPAYNAEDTLSECLEALKAQELPEHIDLEIIVVDDGSSDRTHQITIDARVQVVQTDSPASGPGPARNRGVEVSKGEILLFTDADCAPKPDWAIKMINALEDHSAVGAKGSYQTRQREFMARFIQQEYAFKHRRTAEAKSIDLIDGFSAAYRRDVFIENGGFDPRMKEIADQEFSFRLARKGYRMVFTEEAVVFHYHLRNAWKYLTRKFRIGRWKAIMLRWLPEKAISDTHTPGTQRAQIGFLGLCLISLVLSLFWSPAIYGTAAFGILFLLSTLPFLIYILQHDWKLILLALPLILLRGGAQGIGLFVGLFDRSVEYPEEAEGLFIVQRTLKRVLDISFGGIGFLLSLPLLALASAAVKLDSPGSAFFTQNRVGENGKMFKMIKIRTMVAGAEEKVAQALAINPLQGPVFKVPNDPRVTRVGRILRRWSLDELPQFWNVVRGDMSLVGPRPEEVWIVDQYDDRQRGRLVVKPGLTGPAQIAGRGDLDMEERLELELDYINNYSILKDLEIMVKSIPAVLSARGAY